MSETTQAPSEEQVQAEMRNWIEKAVIGLNLCPFAKSVYVKNQVRIVVSRARHLDAFLDDLDRELELLRDTPAEQVDTTLLVKAATSLAHSFKQNTPQPASNVGVGSAGGY